MHGEKLLLDVLHFPCTTVASHTAKRATIHLCHPKCKKNAHLLLIWLWLNQFQIKYHILFLVKTMLKKKKRKRNFLLFSLVVRLQRGEHGEVN